MSITANIAPNINKEQSDNFYFTVVFTTDSSVEDFSLNNVGITGTVVSIEDLTLLYLESNYAVIAVDLPAVGKGSFTIDLTGTVTIDGVSESITSESKKITYNVVGSSSITYDTTPTATAPSIVILTLSAASIENSGILIAQFDFDYSVPYFDSSHVTVSAGATKSQVEVIDDDFRRWIMLVTVPSSGSGMVDISVDTDAIGFPHDAVRAQAQHANIIPLTILNDRGTLLSASAVLLAEDVDANVTGNLTLADISSITYNGRIRLTLDRLSAGVVRISGSDPDGTAYTTYEAITFQVGGENLLLSERVYQASGLTVSIHAVFGSGRTIDVHFVGEVAEEDDTAQQPIVDATFERVYTIKGNSVNKVDVQGLLEPFYHHWDPTMGKLYIRSLGEVKKRFSDFDFRVIARDVGHEIERETVFRTPKAIPPSIIVPTEPLQIYFGEENELEIQVTNKPTKVEVEGTWLGLDDKKVSLGVVISGTLPARGTGMGEFIPGVTSGDFLVIATNTGGSVQAMVPWELSSPIAPQLVEGAFSDYNIRNQAFASIIKINAHPEPTVEIESGALPTGLTHSVSYAGTTATISFTGTTTALGASTFKFKVTNRFGSIVTPDYTITVYSGLTRPSLRFMFTPGRIINLASGLDVSSNFHLGTPPATFSVSNTTELSITPQGLIKYVGSSTDRLVKVTTDIVLTNPAGSYTERGVIFNVFNF